MGIGWRRSDSAAGGLLDSVSVSPCPRMLVPSAPLRMIQAQSYDASCPMLTLTMFGFCFQAREIFSDLPPVLNGAAEAAASAGTLAGALPYGTAADDAAPFARALRLRGRLDSCQVHAYRPTMASLPQLISVELA
jgi:hypothetical protein